MNVEQQFILITGWDSIDHYVPRLDNPAFSTRINVNTPTTLQSLEQAGRHIACYDDSNGSLTLFGHTSIFFSLSDTSFSLFSFIRLQVEALH